MAMWGSSPIYVTLTDKPFGVARAGTGIPGQGEIWPDSKLLATLGAGVGATLTVGAKSFRVTQVLVARPDQGATFADLAPSVLMNEADLAGTQLIQPGSRVSYSHLFAGPAAAIEGFKEWLETNKQPRERLLDISETTPQIRTAIDRAGRFFSISSLVAVLLCSVAVAMAARRYVQRHLDSVALMKTLGATRAFTLTVSLTQLVLIGLLAAILGTIIGYTVQAWLVLALADLFKTALPPATWGPVGVGLITSVATLAGFALPPLLQLSRTPALRVLRRDVGPPPLIVMLAFGPAITLIYWVLRDPKIAGAFVLGLTGFIALVGGAGWLLVKLAGRLRGGVGVSWRYGIANLGRRRTESVVQLTAFAHGIMVLLLLAVVRNDLLNDWRRSLPTDIPNFFFINIPPGDREPLVQFLQERGAKTSRALPMIRGRLVALNGTSTGEVRFADPRGEGFANREQNMTWTAELGRDNNVIEGRWFTAADRGKPVVSVSTEFQQALGLTLGDKLKFDIAGESYEAAVVSVRKVKWDSFQPNFFLVFPPGLLDGTAGTWMTSAYFSRDQGPAIAELVRRYPSVSVFDLDDLLMQVRTVIDKAVVAVQSVFLFTLFAGFVVLIAAVQASRDERRYESAMLRTLGANRATVRMGVLSEFVTLGVLSGFLAAIGATLAAMYISARVLQIPYTIDPKVWLLGVLGGGVLVAVAGWLATRSVVNQPPLVTLRGA
jgi:putative ABC transport system permease protein